MTNYYRSGGYGLRPNRPYGLCPEGEGDFSNCKHPLAGILNRFLDYPRQWRQFVFVQRGNGDVGMAVLSWLLMRRGWCGVVVGSAQ